MRDGQDITLIEFIDILQNINLAPLDDHSCYIILCTLTNGISAKPILENGVLLRKGDVDCDSWSCPSCKHEFDYNELHYNYCPWCGQRLDWDFSEDFKEEENDR